MWWNQGKKNNMYTIIIVFKNVFKYIQYIFILFIYFIFSKYYKLLIHKYLAIPNVSERSRHMTFYYLN